MAVYERMKRGAELYKRKNSDYGDSWKKTGKILNILFPEGIAINEEKKFTEFSIIIRKVDKLCRITNLLFTEKNINIKSESIVETCEDDGIYSFMLAEYINEVK